MTGKPIKKNLAIELNRYLTKEAIQMIQKHNLTSYQQYKLK